jgi:hypothetical protein
MTRSGADGRNGSWISPPPEINSRSMTFPADPRSDGHAEPAQLGGRSPARSSRHSPALRPRDRAISSLFLLFLQEIYSDRHILPRRSLEV